MATTCEHKEVVQFGGDEGNIRRLQCKACQHPLTVVDGCVVPAVDTPIPCRGCGGAGFVGPSKLDRCEDCAGCGYLCPNCVGDGKEVDSKGNLIPGSVCGMCGGDGLHPKGREQKRNNRIDYLLDEFDAGLL